MTTNNQPAQFFITKTALSTYCPQIEMTMAAIKVCYVLELVWQAELESMATLQRCRRRGVPFFGRSVNPFPTRGTDYAHHIT